jgi:competence protein ComEC
MFNNINIFNVTGSFFFGVCLMLWAEYLPYYNPLILILSLSVICALVWSSKYLRTLIICTLFMLLGLSYISWQVDNFKHHALPDLLQSKSVVIITKIKNVATKGSSQNLTVETLKLTDSDNKLWPVQPTLKLSWYKTNLKPKPGEIWSFKVKVKPPHNYANPGSFDIEKFMFASRIHGIGYIVTSKNTQLLASKPNLIDHIQRLRLNLASFIDKQNYQFGGVIKALTLGINMLPFEQKEVFQKNGLAHLLAISGLHVGLVAALLYKLIQRVSGNYNLRIFMTLAGATVYSTLAGLSIPTQRALIMLGVICLGKILIRHISMLNSLALALLLVVLHDPFCILSIGFWLSFSAVLTIMYLAQHNTRLGLIKFNFFISIAMAPLTILFFKQTSLIAPISNIFFVPIVSVLVVPLGLLAVILSLISELLAQSLFSLINSILALSWPILTKLSQVPIYELTLQPAQYIYLVLVSGGIFYVLYPKKLPYKPAAVLCFLPLYLYTPSKIAYGEVKFTQLDVGQGACSVLQTTNHTLIYDTGPKGFGFDAGSQVLVPFLKYERIKQIDLLIISHADNDHIGGTQALMTSMPVKKILAGESEKLEQYPLTLCNRGQSWTFDGVKFEILHPDQLAIGKKRNDKSCVLKITSKSNKTILITGDIEKKSEKQLLQYYTPAQLAADVLIAPHHGSKTSSSQEFIEALQPKISIFPTGYKNRYGHPKMETIHKYRKLHSKVLDTSYAGAISFLTTNQRLTVASYRQDNKKFWHKEL